MTQSVTRNSLYGFPICIGILALGLGLTILFYQKLPIECVRLKRVTVGVPLSSLGSLSALVGLALCLCKRKKTEKEEKSTPKPPKSPPDFGNHPLWVSDETFAEFDIKKLDDPFAINRLSE